jgi:putative transposase
MTAILVLATCHIRPLNQVFESTFPCLSQFADSPEEEYNRDAFICSTSKGVTYTVHGILTFISRSIGLCLQSLHHRFKDWTKPSTTSLLLGSLTDLPRSKSELMTENALLRQQLIVLRRHVKRPTFTKTDRLLLILLARAGRDLETRAVDCSARDGSRGGIARDARLFWKYKSRAGSPQPKISEATVA